MPVKFGSKKLLNASRKIFSSWQNLQSFTICVERKAISCNCYHYEEPSLFILLGRSQHGALKSFLNVKLFVSVFVFMKWRIFVTLPPCSRQPISLYYFWCMDNQLGYCIFSRIHNSTSRKIDRRYINSNCFFTFVNCSGYFRSIGLWQQL